MSQIPRFIFPPFSLSAFKKPSHDKHSKEETCMLDYTNRPLTIARWEGTECVISHGVLPTQLALRTKMEPRWPFSEKGPLKW